MPGLDGTGPFGDLEWPCRRIYGRGLARGFRRGFGRGFGYRFVQPAAQSVELTKEEQRKILEAEKAELEIEIKNLAKRLKELK